MASAMQFADYLCNRSDKHFEEVKSHVAKWVSEKRWRDKETDSRGNGPVEQFWKGIA